MGASSTVRHLSISLASTSPINTVLGVVQEGGVERESEEVELERDDSRGDGVRGREDDEAPKLCMCSLPSHDSTSGKQEQSDHGAKSGQKDGKIRSTKGVLHPQGVSSYHFQHTVT